MNTYGQLKKCLKMQFVLADILESHITVTPEMMSMNIYLPTYCGIRKVAQVARIIHDYAPACLLFNIMRTNNCALFD